MKSFLAFAVFGSTNAQNDAMANSTQSLRSLLSPRDGLSSTGAPKLSGKYCGWEPHGNSVKNRCRLTFSGDKMRIEWKKKSGNSRSDCKDGKGPEHACCLCGNERNMDCKDESYKISPGSHLTSGLLSSGYDVEWTGTDSSSNCIRKIMGEDKNAMSHVPLRIKIHDEGHLDLLECQQQDDSYCDGSGAKCDVTKNKDGHDCDTWDQDHSDIAPCRRRAGCKSRGLPVPSFDVEEADEEFDDDEFDVVDIELNTEVV